MKSCGKGKFAKRYGLNYSDKRLRDLNSYIFLPKDSPPHTCQGYKLLDPVKLDYRETHCNEGKKRKKEQTREVLELFDIRRNYGVQTAGTVGGKRKNE